jgi:hypothetical protein
MAEKKNFTFSIDSIKKKSWTRIYI